MTHDIKKSNNNETDYRRILSTASKLETIQANLESVIDFFSEPVVGLYSNLCNDCFKILFDSEFKLDHYRKTEELLWRRIYHDIYRFHKNNRRGLRRQDEFLLESHFISGIGFYSSLIVKLRSHFRITDQPGLPTPLNMSLGPIDNFVNNQPLNYTNATDANILSINHHQFNQDELASQDDSVISSDNLVREWARQSIYRSLVYMGDLARYLLEIGQSTCYRTLAYDFYRSASRNQPDNGLPYNQLATLAGNSNHNLDAVCNYIRCCMKPKPFEGAEGNMRKLFELNKKNYLNLASTDDVWTASHVLASTEPANQAQRLVKFIISIFIKLVSDFWLVMCDDIKFETVRSDLVDTTRVFFEVLREALEFERTILFSEPNDQEFNPIAGDQPSSSSKLQPSYITPTIMYEFCNVTMILIAKCQKVRMENTTISVKMDQVITHINTLALNLLHYSTSKCQRLIVGKLQEIKLSIEKTNIEAIFASIYETTYLPTVKIFCDWLLSSGDIISSNVQSFLAFCIELDELVSLIKDVIKLAEQDTGWCSTRLINPNSCYMHTFDGPTWTQRYPLSCDLPLINLEPLKNIHSQNIDFNHKSDLTQPEAGFMTMQCIVAFSHALTAFLANKILA